MERICPIRFITSEKNISIYKILVFTVNSYTRFIEERGRNYVFDLFMEVCRGKRCQFLGLKSEGSYIYALIGINGKKENIRGTAEERSCGACR